MTWIPAFISVTVRDLQRMDQMATAYGCRLGVMTYNGEAVLNFDAPSLDRAALLDAALGLDDLPPVVFRRQLDGEWEVSYPAVGTADVL